LNKVFVSVANVTQVVKLYFKIDLKYILYMFSKRTKDMNLKVKLEQKNNEIYKLKLLLELKEKKIK
jgi:hypothetical protein